nr:YitT family protein [Bacillus sp. Marseille-P3661]
MSFGIVLTIKANLGAAPWDVLHVGLNKQFGLTIGTWSIIVGVIILSTTSLLSKSLPQLGAFLNMMLVGVFIDMYLLLPWLKTPDTVIGQVIMFIAGIVVLAYGMSFYISANCGAGPRDSLMLVLMEKTKIKVQWIRLIMEVVVLSVGWLLGGPVFIGTIIFCIIIGHITGFALPQCRVLVEHILHSHNHNHPVKQTALTK